MITDETLMERFALQCNFNDLEYVRHFSIEPSRSRRAKLSIKILFVITNAHPVPLIVLAKNIVGDILKHSAIRAILKSWEIFVGDS